MYLLWSERYRKGLGKSETQGCHVNSQGIGNEQFQPRITPQRNVNVQKGLRKNAKARNRGSGEGATKPLKTAEIGAFNDDNYLARESFHEDLHDSREKECVPELNLSAVNNFPNGGQNHEGHAEQITTRDIVYPGSHPILGSFFRTWHSSSVHHGRRSLEGSMAFDVD